MKYEVTRTLNKYLYYKCNNVKYLGSDSGVRMFFDFYKNGEIIEGDRPDMVIIKNNTAIVVEHFEFDSSKTSKKSSSNREEIARIERELQKKTKENKECIHQDAIRASFTYQNYVSNVTRNFLEHYNKIEKYRSNLIGKNIITEDYIVKNMFLIEDVTPIGSVAIDINKDRNKEEPILLARCPEFLDLVASHHGVDYVMCCSYVGNNEYIWFIDCNDISSYKEWQLDYANMRFFENQACVVAGSFCVSVEEN